MIRVCDCIMGSGKSSAAITFINEHPERKFIYITPYLDEAARIKAGCPDANFIEPSNKIWKYKNKKIVHTAALIKEGQNIATTHRAFMHYDLDMLEAIREHQYTLIIDEDVEVLESFKFNPGDLQLAIDAGYIKEENGIYHLVRYDYNGEVLKKMFTMLKSRNLVRTEFQKGEAIFFWVLPPELINAFQDVFVLTYLFEGQSIHHFLEVSHIPYTYIGIERRPDGSFCFGSFPGYTPEYVTHLKDVIHVLSHEKLNSIGKNRCAVSKTWLSQNRAGAAQLRLNIQNCYKNIWGEVPADQRLWATFKSAYGGLKGKGYTKSYLAFNTKATNQYRSRDHLVYAANVFMNVDEKALYQSFGIEVNDDMYALSIMVQWIWRSAIRDGKEIWIYIPSRRMRELLLNWIDSFSEGGSDND